MFETEKTGNEPDDKGESGGAAAGENAGDEKAEGDETEKTGDEKAG